MWTNLQILAGLFTFITVIFRKAPLFAKWKLINISSDWKVTICEVISGPNTGKYGPEITPYLGTFHAVIYSVLFIFFLKYFALLIIDLPTFFADGTFWSIMPVISCFRLKLTSQPDKFFAFMLICFCRLPILKMLSSVVKMLFVELAFFCEFYQ